MNWSLWTVKPFGSHPLLLFTVPLPFYETRETQFLERSSPGLSHSEVSFPKGTHPQKSCHIFSVAFTAAYDFDTVCALLSAWTVDSEPCLFTQSPLF